MALGEAPALVILYQTVVVPLRNRQLKKRLQKSVQVRGLKEVFSTGDQSDVLKGIIQGHREMVTGPDILARQHNVAEDLRRCGHLSLFPIEPGERSGDSLRATDIQTQCKGQARCFAILPLLGCEVSTEAGIKWAIRAVRSRGRAFDLRFDISPRAKAGIKQLHVGEVLERPGVGVTPRRLKQGRCIPFKAQPGQVFDHLPDEVRAAACAVDIFDSQQKPSIVLSRRLFRKQA